MVICIPTAKVFPLESFAMYRTSMMLLSGGTDVLGVAYILYRCTVSWRDLGLQELRNSRTRRIILPLMTHALHWEMTWSSASSSSCTDWVWYHLQDSYQVWSPEYCSEKPGSSLVPDFNSPRLTESSIQTAGKMSQTSYRPGTFDDLHLATFNSNALTLGI